MNCKHCSKELPPVKPGGHPPRQYCNDACRQAYYRKQHQQDQAQGRTFTELLSELTELRVQVEDQEKEITRLKHLLDVERRYYQDTQPHTFKSWLKKQPPTSVGEKLLSDPLVPTRTSRANYEAHVKRLHCSEEEHQEFVRLWKLMLLSRP